jgi:Luciferase
MKERTMTNQALSTLPRRAKGPIAPPPALAGKLKAVADAVAAWPDVEATIHWRFDQPDRVDGVDFYVGSDELGHIHLDGSIHLATTPQLGAELVAEGAGQPFMWASGWTTASIHRLGVDGSVALFRRNYDRLRSPGE